MLTVNAFILAAVFALWALGHFVLDYRLKARTAAVEAREQLVDAREHRSETDEALALTMDEYMANHHAWHRNGVLWPAVRERDADLCRCCGYPTINGDGHPSGRYYMLLDPEAYPLTASDFALVHRKCLPTEGELFVLLPAGATADQVARGEVTGTVMRRGGRI